MTEYTDRYAQVNNLNNGYGPSIDAARALALMDAWGLTAFVETGIWHGGTTLWAAQQFAFVYACDIDELWVAHARARLVEYPNVRITLGDSRRFLTDLMRTLNQPALIYLDAHYIADRHSAGNPVECPLLGELAALRTGMVKHVVVIDDARLIVGRDPDYLYWPTMEEVRAALPGWEIAQEANALVAVPEA